MSAIPRDLPYSDRPSTVEVHGRTFAVKRDQIILWISLSEKGLEQPDPRTPRFPAILDTGCNCNLLINQRPLMYPTVSQSLELEYVIQGHRVRVVTLDLNADWQQIRQRLLGILRPGPASDRANGASAGATDISSARGG